MLVLGSPPYGFKDHFYGFMPLILGGKGGGDFFSVFWRYAFWVVIK